MNSVCDRVELNEGYSMRVIKYFEGDNYIYTKEQHCNTWGRIVYTKEYNDDGVFYESWRTWDNDELMEIRDTNGVCYKFDNSIPVKEEEE